MDKLVSGLVIGVVSTLILAGGAYAHTPLLYIEDNEDGTIYVEAGFSDGSGASGMPCRLKDKDGNVLWEGKFDEYSSLTIEKPDVVPYYVVFDGGPGHVVTKEGPPLTPAEGGTAGMPVEEAPPVASPAAAPEEAPAAAAPTPTAPVAQPSPIWTPGAETPAWTPGTTTPTSEKPDQTPLWVIVGLLSVIALAAVLICAGVLVFIGWTMGHRSHE